jgi:hypothetical protein
MRRAVGRLEVYTFKAGLLSVAAHDLHLRLDEFSVSLDGDAVEAEFALERLHLVGPVEDGVTLHGRYRPDQVAAVESAMRGEVLRTHQHPTARLAGRAQARGDGWEVSGTLAMAGAQAPISLTFRKAGDEYLASVELRPSRWGIAEYHALLGAIRLQDRVRVEVAVAASG